MRSIKSKNLSTCSFVVCALLTICFVFGSRSALAQDSTDENPAESAVSESDGVETAWDHLIYLPYKDIREILSRDDSQIVLPYAEYIRLWRAAQKLGQPGTAVKTLITKADYRAEVNEDWVKINAHFDVQSLADGRTELPIHFENVAVGKLTSDNGNVLLRSAGAGQYSLILPEKGTFSVDLELSSRIKTSAQGRHLSCGIPSVAMTTFHLLIPEADQEVELMPHLGKLPVEAAEGTTEVKAELGATDQVTARWHPRASLKPEMDLLTTVTNNIEITVDESVVHKQARLQFQVLRGELTESKIVAGIDDRILDVTALGAAIKTWKVEKQDDQQVITVEWLSPVKKSATLEIQVETKLPIGPFQVAGVSSDKQAFGIHVMGAARESGEVSITSAQSMSIAIEEQEGVVRVSETAGGGDKQATDRLAYRFFNPRFALKVSAHPIEPHVVVHQNCQFSFSEDELQLRSVFNYKITKAGIFGFEIQVPQGLVVDAVQCPGLAKYTVDPQSNHLTVSLQSKSQGDITLVVDAHQSLESEDYSEFESLPIPRPEQTKIETGRISIYASESLEIVADEASVAGARPDLTANPVGFDNRQQVSTPVSKRFLAVWTYHRRPVELPVRRVRKPTRLTANVTTAVSVNLELIEVRSQVEFTVEHAGQNVFRIAVPESVGDDVSIRPLANSSTSSAHIQQKVRSEQSEDGMVTWTITMQQRVIGQQSFEVRYDWKPTVSEVDSAKSSEKQQSLSAEIPLVRALGMTTEAGGNSNIDLARVVGEVAIQKDRALSLTSAADGPDVESIDIRELKRPDAVAHWAFRYTQQPVLLKLKAVRYDVQDVIRTVISRALVEIAVGQGNESAYCCRYRLRSSERQRLSIDLPAGMKPLAVWVDQKPIKLEQNATAQVQEGWTSYFVNIARQKSSQDEFYLTFQFLSEATADAFNEQGGKLQLKMPRIEGESEDTVVQQLKTVVWVPEKVALVKTPADFLSDNVLGAANSGTENIKAWIGGDGIEMIDFPRQGHAYHYHKLGGADHITVTWWKMPFYTLWISGAIAVLAFLLRGISLESKISLLLATGLGLILYALFDAEAVYHILMAARYGIVALVAIWAIHLVFQWNRQTDMRLAAAGGTDSGVVTTTSRRSDDSSAEIADVESQSDADSSNTDSQSGKEEPPPEDRPDISS